MNKVIAWIAGILAGLAIIAFLLIGRSDRQAYRAAKGAIEERSVISQERIDTAVEMATQTVDVALKLAGDLPSQQAEADLIKQDIEEIGKRLSEASGARAELSLIKLNDSIELFNATLDKVDAAAQKAEDPAVKTRLDRIYGVLMGAKEQLVNTILNYQD